MTRDAKESLTALGAVFAFLGVGVLVLLLLPDDIKIPRWIWWTGFAANTAILIGLFLRRRRMRREKPD